MKTLFLFFAFGVLVYSQPEHTGEFMIDLVNQGSTWNVTFLATAVSARWDENFELTEDYETASVSISQIVSQARFDLIIDILAGNNPVLALGLYRISAIENNVEKAYFYMDWRTYFPESHPSPDVYFKYDYLNKRFRNSANTLTVDGTYQTVWDLVQGITYQTTELEDYWDNCLALIKSDNGDNPRLIWGPHNQVTAEEFYVYRGITQNLNPPPTPSFSVYDTVSSSTYIFIDDVLIGGPYLAYYYVIAGYLPQEESPLFETDASNTVVTQCCNQQKQVSEINTEEYTVLQNYPNPFNPNTTIKYTLAKDDYVTLRIYNLLGQEIATIVNETQGAGSYSYEFNASSLSSGIYLYKIQTTEFTSVRKMSLLK